MIVSIGFVVTGYGTFVPMAVADCGTTDQNVDFVYETLEQTVDMVD